MKLGGVWPQRLRLLFVPSRLGLPPCRLGKRAGFSNTLKWWVKSPGWVFNNHSWGPISTARCRSWVLGSVLSSSLCLPQGLDFPVLPSPWKFPELTTRSLEPVQVNDLFQDVDLERQNAECKVGIGLRRSCRLCLQTECHPVCLASLVCRVQPGVGWGDHQGFRGQPGLLFLSPISSSTPTLMAFLQQSAGSARLSLRLESLVYWRGICVWVTWSFNVLWNWKPCRSLYSKCLYFSGWPCEISLRQICILPSCRLYLICFLVYVADIQWSVICLRSGTYNKDPASNPCIESLYTQCSRNN